MKRIAISLLLLTAITFSAGAQTQSRTIPFKDGEKLRYTISYKIGLVNTDVADVHFNTTEVAQDEKEMFNIHAYSVTYPLYKTFFDINDHYNSRLEKSTLRPVQLTTELQEGKYRFSSRFVYDWDDRVVRTYARNHAKNPDFIERTLTMPGSSFDAVSFFFNLRSQDLDSYKEGESFVINLVLEDTIRRISYRYAGKETIDIKGYGKFRTLKFICNMATSESVTFEDGTELFMWISDDMNKIPIYIMTPIKIGTVRARLTGFEGLKFPLSSRVR